MRLSICVFQFPCLIDIRSLDSKFAGDPAATLAFQKVSLAYSVLADPARRRRYDAAPADFAAQGMGGARAEETLRGVVLGVFNDFLDGDMEVVRTLLRECSPCWPPCYSEIMGAARRAVEVERKMRVLFASPMCLVLWPCARCPRLSAHMTRVIHASFEMRSISVAFASRGSAVLNFAMSGLCASLYDRRP